MTRDELIEIVNDDYKLDDAISPGDVIAMQIFHEVREDKSRNIISAAEHDVIYFDFDIDKDGWKLTESQARILNLCGINFDEDLDSFYKFV